MNRIYLFIIGSLISLTINAQTKDTVSVEAGYANQTYYSLENGTVKRNPIDNWDLAFSTGIYNVAIRVNDIASSLYLYPHGNKTAWSTVDTSGISSWDKKYNSNTDWSEGAFNKPTTSDFDQGWGMYEMTDHNIYGDSIYIVKTTNGDYKKLLITKKESIAGKYHFSYANIDGSDSVGVVLNTGNESTNFIYYSLENQTTVDNEPGKGEWDLLFTQYNAELAPDFYYHVTGVLVNSTLKTYVFNSASVEEASKEKASLAESISAIGYDWKTFNRSSGQYIIKDSLTFFLENEATDIYQVTLTGFEGSSTGKIALETQKTDISTGFFSFDHNENNSLKLYPNPGTSNNPSYLEIDQNFNLSSAKVSIQGVDGKVYDQTGVVTMNTRIQLPSLNPGMYIISVETGNTTFSQKLIIE